MYWNKSEIKAEELRVRGYTVNTEAVDGLTHYFFMQDSEKLKAIEPVILPLINCYASSPLVTTCKLAAEQLEMPDSLLFWASNTNWEIDTESKEIKLVPGTSFVFILDKFYLTCAMGEQTFDFILLDNGKMLVKVHDGYRFIIALNGGYVALTYSSQAGCWFVAPVDSAELDFCYEINGEVLKHHYDAAKDRYVSGNFDIIRLTYQYKIIVSFEKNTTSKYDKYLSSVPVLCDEYGRPCSLRDRVSSRPKSSVSDITFGNDDDFRSMFSEGSDGKSLKDFDIDSEDTELEFESDAELESVVELESDAEVEQNEDGLDIESEAEFDINIDALNIHSLHSSKDSFLDAEDLEDSEEDDDSMEVKDDEDLSDTKLGDDERITDLLIDDVATQLD